VIAPIRAIIRRGFEWIERPFERLFGPALNPLAQLGALGFFFFWIVAVSGIYLFIFFDTGIERAYESVERISTIYWYHAGVMRSFHRYASDLLVVMVVVHLLREFAYDHYRGVRWYSWLTGLPIIWLLYGSGITGYWLVWDKLAHFVAITSSELLDWLKLLMVEDIGPEMLRERDPKKLIPPLAGALIKNEQDVHLFERLAFMARREGR